MWQASEKRRHKKCTDVCGYGKLQKEVIEKHAQVPGSILTAVLLFDQKPWFKASGGKRPFKNKHVELRSNALQPLFLPREPQPLSNYPNRLESSLFSVPP
jgi:hypothetical protein